MGSARKHSAGNTEFRTTSNVAIRKAVGYIRVSTDMQAAEGLSLEAQQAAIESYCALQASRWSGSARTSSRAARRRDLACRRRWIRCSVAPEPSPRF